MLLYFLHQDLQKVWSTHTGSCSNLAIEGVCHLLRLGIEGENALKLTITWASELALLGKLVMVRNHYLLWAFALRHRGLRLPVIVIKSTLSVATISPVPATLHHLLLHLSFTCIGYALLSLLTVQHFSQCTLFHRKPAIQFMLLLNPSLSLLLLSFHLFFSLRLSSFISFIFYRSIHHIAQLHRVARRIGRPPSTRWHERSRSLSLYFRRIVTN